MRGEQFQHLTTTCMKATIESIEAHLPIKDGEHDELRELYEKLLDLQHKIVCGYERKRLTFDKEN